ncbi:MAG: dihydropteroate synthase [Nitrospirae bacterium]|nr:dihydropteroate synthase [Nitrospirota bacterium]
MRLTWNRFDLDLDLKTHIMGIVNTTPDSFSDGGRYFDKDKAVAHALRMLDDGADIIDIGGESTRPGSAPVPIDEELRRTVPVIESLAKACPAPISIDTCKAGVARRALDAGAAMVNDISGLRSDPDMPSVVARHGVPVVIMHMKGRPADMQINPSYGALIPEIIGFFRESIRIALDAGIGQDLIILDPGIGFGKTFNNNLEIINRLAGFRILDKPLMIGTSRKAFIGKILDDAPPSERIEGTAATVTASILNGANIIRVHDVRQIARVAKVTDAIKREKVLP